MPEEHEEYISSLPHLSSCQKNKNKNDLSYPSLRCRMLCQLAVSHFYTVGIKTNFGFWAVWFRASHSILYFLVSSSACPACSIAGNKQQKQRLTSGDLVLGPAWRIAAPSFANRQEFSAIKSEAGALILQIQSHCRRTIQS